MTRHPFRSTIFITAMLAASAAFAGADIVKCVDQHGNVTLTDAQCSDGVAAAVVPAEAPDMAPADAAAQPVTPAVRRVATQRVASAPPPLQHDNWTPAKPAGRMLARDIETLKAARLSMRVLDDASAAMRQQRLAGLN